MQPGKTIKLPSGDELYIDLGNITRKEWVSLLDFNQPDEEEAALMCKIFDCTLEEYDNLPAADWRFATASVFGFMKEIRNAALRIDDPKV